MPATKNTLAPALKAIRQALLKAGLPPEELAEELNCDLTLVEHWLAGDAPIPMEALSTIALHCGLDQIALMKQFGKEYLDEGISHFLDELIRETIARANAEGG